MTVTLSSGSSAIASQAERASFARWDFLFVALALVHGLLLWKLPSTLLIAIGLWWNANTISHNFIHRPFFRTRLCNKLFSAYLTLLLGFPQSLWRQRHLCHHAEVRRPLHWNHYLTVDTGITVTLWAALLASAGHFTLTVYLPGFLLGLVLCQIHGYFEHWRGTVSHHGNLYNLLLFNDGYHAEHHARPGAHWRQLPMQVERKAQISRWPAILRWIESVDLCLLERWVLHSWLLQRFVVRVHTRALSKLLPLLPPLQRVEIVGGGLFPRTALILKRIAPNARLTLIDMSAENLRCAREFLGDVVEYLNDYFDPAAGYDSDLMVIPLALVGDRQAIYDSPPAPRVLVHDWIWRRRGSSVIVSWLLLKRLNLVVRSELRER